jgi:hypothetical protein
MISAGGADVADVKVEVGADNHKHHDDVSLTLAEAEDPTASTKSASADVETPTGAKKSHKPKKHKTQKGHNKGEKSTE